MASFYDYTFERLGRSEKSPTYATLNDPVLLFNRFRIYEVMTSLGIVIIFGVVQGQWLMSAMGVALMLMISPAMRKRMPPSQLYRWLRDFMQPLPVGRFTWGKTKGPL